MNQSFLNMATIKLLQLKSDLITIKICRNTFISLVALQYSPEINNLLYKITG